MHSRDAVKAGLPDLAQRIRSEMLEGEGAKHLDAVLKDTRALDAIGGEWSIDRQLIRVDTLGEGGGGKVYRAIDLRDGKEVAVKEVSLATHSKEQRERIVGFGAQRICGGGDAVGTFGHRQCARPIERP